MKRLLMAALLACTAQVAVGQDMVTYRTNQSFDDVIFGLENAILDQGLIVDQISHVGEMLERTRADLESDTVLFVQADIYSFCSASLSRKMMEADPMNIAYCPYNIFVVERADTPGEITIGFRTLPQGPMQEAQALLDDIAREAIGQ